MMYIKLVPGMVIVMDMDTGMGIRMEVRKEKMEMVVTLNQIILLQ